ncbi:hypothetical protein ABPG74_004686 [Tetrahymena malaccensis]
MISSIDNKKQDRFVRKTNKVAKFDFQYLKDKINISTEYALHRLCPPKKKGHIPQGVRCFYGAQRLRAHILKDQAQQQNFTQFIFKNLKTIPLSQNFQYFSNSIHNPNPQLNREPVEQGLFQ